MFPHSRFPRMLFLVALISASQTVAAGLTPIRQFTPARVARAYTRRRQGSWNDRGGKWADLIILDSHPLADIPTRGVWRLVHKGDLVDRSAILKAVKLR